MTMWKKPTFRPIWLAYSMAVAPFTNCVAQEKAATTIMEEKDTQTIQLTLKPNTQFQSIDNFGASDAWTGQFVGNWPAAKKAAIADLLFSRDTLQSGQPKGIGLSLWRFNIGAGTAEQGQKSHINDEWRRAESFLSTDGTYDWNKQSGQVWFLKAAQKRGVDQFLGFTNSPPVSLTKNGKGFANADEAKQGIPNLALDSVDRFTDFLTEVTLGIKKHTGVTLNYLSPVNEPQWDWSNGDQEGTPFFNDQIAAITRSLSKSLLKKGLPTKIDIAEAGQIDFLYGNHNKPAGRGNQVEVFFGKKSENYLGDLPNVSKTISAHSYFTTSPETAAVSKRQKLTKAVQTVPGLKYWMSEYCILGGNSGEINGNKKDLGIVSALYTAKVIHNDLVHAQASAWHWWLAISPYDYKDGLIYIDKNKTDGNFEASKMLWALGQYSRFIQPGAKRIAIEANRSHALLVSAYRNENNEMVTVLVNPTSQAIPIALQMENGNLGSLRGYQTSADQNLERIQAGSNMTIAPESITTLIAQ